MKYQTSEIEKLEDMLRKAGIRFFTVTPPSFGQDENCRILLYFGNSGQRVGFGFEALTAPNRKCSVINYGYGSDQGLLEMSGLLSMLPNHKNEKDNSCVGNLTAEEVFACIQSDWEKSEIEIKDGILIHMRANGDVYIPDGVLEIGESALKGHIESVVVPPGVQKIHNYAFADQWDLEFVRLPSSICEIADNAFEGVDHQYFHIYAPAGSYAANWARKDPHSYLLDTYCPYHLEDGKLIFDQIVDYIPSKQISKEEATLVKEICIPEGVEDIEFDAFEECKNVETLTFPSTLKKVRCQFHSNTHLRTVKFPYGITEIMECTFTNTGIESLEIPGSVTRIGEYAFSDCPIRRLVIGHGVETIEAYAFEGTNLSEVILPKSVKYIGKDAFSNANYEQITIIRE